MPKEKTKACSHPARCCCSCCTINVKPAEFCACLCSTCKARKRRALLLKGGNTVLEHSTPVQFDGLLNFVLDPKVTTPAFVTVDTSSTTTSSKNGNKRVTDPNLPVPKRPKSMRCICSCFCNFLATYPWSTEDTVQFKSMQSEFDGPKTNQTCKKKPETYDKVAPEAVAIGLLLFRISTFV